MRIELDDGSLLMESAVVRPTPGTAYPSRVRIGRRSFMKRRTAVRLLVAALVTAGLVFGVAPCVDHLLFDQFTQTTTRPLATSPSGEYVVVEETVNHGAFRSYRHLRLEDSRVGSTPIASSDWAFEFSAKWLDEARVEICARRLGAADTVECATEPYILGGKRIEVVFVPTEGTRVVRHREGSTK